MSESSPVNQAFIAYVIGIILLLAFSMLIGMMIKSESEKQALILLNPETIASQVLNTGDSELCKKKWRGRFCPPVSMPLSHPDLQ
jgi:purine-cytosine permease-like protein